MNTSTGATLGVGIGFITNVFSSFSLDFFLPVGFFFGVFLSDDLKLPLRGSLTIHDGGTIIREWTPVGYGQLRFLIKISHGNEPLLSSSTFYCCHREWKKLIREKFFCYGMSRLYELSFRLVMQINNGFAETFFFKVISLIKECLPDDSTKRQSHLTSIPRRFAEGWNKPPYYDMTIYTRHKIKQQSLLN